MRVCGVHLVSAVFYCALDKMKANKIISYYLRILALFFIILDCCLHCQSQRADYFIDPSASFVHFEGWGSSLAWFGDVLGGMPEIVQNEINSALFSPDKLNLNILRYTIGGTIPGNYTCGDFRPGAATESFKDGPDIPYNWSRDARARSVLLAARNLGVDTFEAFSNSPPQWMTITGCSKGNEGGGSLHANFDAANADLFTDYLTEVVWHYQQVYNITFQSLEPFNEPSSGYWNGRNSGQEGCCMERSTMAVVIGSLHSALLRKNLTSTRISVADETSIDVEITTQDYFRSQGLTGIIHKVNTHGYSGNRRDLLYSIAQRGGHVLWMNEMGWGATSDMEQGLNVGRRIVLDMRNLLPSAWVYWQAMEDRGSQFWGLLDIPYDDPRVENIRYNSGYWAMMQFSHYIRKGYTIIHVNDPNSLAAYDTSLRRFILVIVNDGVLDVRKTYDLGAFSSIGYAGATRTSPSEYHFPIESPQISDRILNFEAKAESVSTIFVNDAIYEPSGNLIQNADFEKGNADVSPWTLFFGGTGGANQEYVRKGRFSGYITASTSDLSLNQDLVAPASKIYLLTAWCATSGLGVKLGVKVNDVQGQELAINQSKGYEVYGIAFNASTGDKISIYLYSPRNFGDSYIDDVVLH